MREGGIGKTASGRRGEGRKSARWTAVRAFLAAACALLLAAGMALAALGLAERAACERLARESSELVDAADGDATSVDVDWESLLSENGSTVAWLSVGGTSIDVAVVQPEGSQDSEYYLHRDFWGSPSAAGWPYLDVRSDADEGHCLVYGHHLGFSDRMFSELYDAYVQDSFDGLGDALWMTPDGGTTVFEPCLALSVDADYPGIQEFSFESSEELEAWLAALADSATALSASAEEQVASATRALTLVTCSSTVGGRRWRTLVVFVAGR